MKSGGVLIGVVVLVFLVGAGLFSVSSLSFVQEGSPDFVYEAIQRYDCSTDRVSGVRSCFAIMLSPALKSGDAVVMRAVASAPGSLNGRLAVGGKEMVFLPGQKMAVLPFIEVLYEPSAVVKGEGGIEGLTQRWLVFVDMEGATDVEVSGERFVSLNEQGASYQVGIDSRFSLPLKGVLRVDEQGLLFRRESVERSFDVSLAKGLTVVDVPIHSGVLGDQSHRVLVSAVFEKSGNLYYASSKKVTDVPVRVGVDVQGEGLKAISSGVDAPVIVDLGSGKPILDDFGMALVVGLLLVFGVFLFFDKRRR